MIRNSFIFLAFCFLPFSALLAQKEGTPAPLTDSLNIFKTDTSALITAKKINELSKLALDSDIDTAMISFHYYNPAYKESFAPQILGNTGSSFQNTVFDDRPSQSAFIFANPLLLYFHNPFKQQHYNTRRPFTEVSYISSGNKTTSEQVISALHTQNFNKYINIGVRYDLIASRGVYLNQEVKSNRFTLFGSYDKDNYSIYSSVSSNKTKALENGGLLDIPAFLLHQANDPIAYQMSLYDASSSLKNVSFFATQSYRFKKTVADTSSVKSDSLQVTTEKDLPFMVNHTFRYDRFSRAYSDNESSIDSLSFYPNQYYNHNATYDSAFRQVLENSFQISGDEYKFLPGFILGIKHQFTSYSYLYPRQSSIIEGETVRDTVIASDFATNYNNLSVYAMLLFNKKSSITYQGKAEYYVAGYRQNDFLADFSLKYKRKTSNASISATGKFYATEPDFFLKHYSSSHFQWSTAFPKTTTSSAFLTFTSGNGTVYAEGGMSLLGNYIYLDNMAMPAKADKNILVTSFRLEKKFSWGGFNHIHKLILQKVNHEVYLQLPLLAYGNTSYYENAFFKNVLKFQIGFDFYVNTSYYADAFMPATGMFYRQDNAKLGEYPFLDGFFNWKVKRTRFFLKYTNALAGLAGHNYFTSFGYPMNPGSLKFGLSWTFYD